MTTMASIDTISWLSMSSIIFLPFLWLLIWLLRLAFFRKAVVYLGELHDTDHPYCEARGGWTSAKRATELTYPGSCKGEARMLESASVVIHVDKKGQGNGGEPIGRVDCLQNNPDHHEVFPQGSEEFLYQVPSGGERTWRDLWMGARNPIPGGMWVKETGLLFRKQCGGSQISLCARSAAAALLYHQEQATQEEEPIIPARGLADLLVPSVLIYLACYPWLLAASLAPHFLYAIYVGILLILHVVVTVLESVQRDRVRRWLEMLNRNTGLHKWNAAIVVVGAFYALMCVSSGNFASLPFVLVTLIAVLINWCHATSALWKIKPRIQP